MRYIAITLISLSIGSFFGYFLNQGESTAAQAEQPQAHDIYPTQPKPHANTMATSNNSTCKINADSLVSIRQTVKQELEKSASFSPTPGTDTVRTANEESTPTTEQKRLYDAVTQRLYSYATSDRPMLESLADDPDFQQLSATQKRRVGRKITTRFNNGEITVEQLRGNRP